MTGPDLSFPPPPSNPPSAPFPGQPGYPGAAPFPGQPGYPGSGRWDQPMAPYPQPTPSQLPLSKAAVASLVFGIIGGIVFAIGFGVAGLSATANGTRRGRGFAWAGIVLALVWVVGIIAVVALVSSRQADRNLDGSVKNAGTSDVLSLQRGDCLQDPTASPSSTVTNVDVMPCTQAHDAQVFSVVSVSEGDGSYDQTRIRAEVEQLCTDAAGTAITTSDRYDLLYFYPQANGWRDGSRTAVCVLKSDTPLTRSVVSS